MCGVGGECGGRLASGSVEYAESGALVEAQRLAALYVKAKGRDTLEADSPVASVNGSSLQPCLGPILLLDDSAQVIRFHSVNELEGNSLVGWASHFSPKVYTVTAGARG